MQLMSSKHSNGTMNPNNDRRVTVVEYQVILYNSWWDLFKKQVFYGDQFKHISYRIGTQHGYI